MKIETETENGWDGDDMYGVSIGWVGGYSADIAAQRKGTTRVGSAETTEKLTGKQSKNWSPPSRARQPDTRWDINKILVWDILRLGRHYQRHRPGTGQSGPPRGPIWNGSIRNLADMPGGQDATGGKDEQALTQDKDKRIGQASRDRPGQRHPRMALSPSMGRWSGYTACPGLAIIRFHCSIGSSKRQRYQFQHLHWPSAISPSWGTPQSQPVTSSESQPTMPRLVAGAYLIAGPADSMASSKIFIRQCDESFQLPSSRMITGLLHRHTKRKWFDFTTGGRGPTLGHVRLPACQALIT
ncbi:uncharacterized protein BO80DRAFT_153753 [Aspergillus ibericus CBS 121593]|uniref:Uncharacterized protein n=1 Tax=Aspergillus ibericus CBS 121593 TaxID=1448316 RepID=A0A395GVA1_9EURO|nr:hypothetical protein BO80DRAFT_153753 [Aspergillus ibericus CBS 121593]RAK98607.1 hypothetical protein BO80DRAFT_153753 [Aspergillus ibericus CBS 121593]